MNASDWLDGIGRDMGIHKSPWEKRFQYEQRVLLSYASIWMLTSLHDADGMVSVKHVSEATERRLGAILDFFPEYQNISIANTVEHIWNTHIANGNVYHKAYRAMPPRLKLIGNSQVSIVRGMKLEMPVSMSGLTPFIQLEAEYQEVWDEFQLPEQTPQQILNSLWKRGQHYPFAPMKNCEYLNLYRKDRETYYSPQRPTGNEMTIMRANREDGGRDYALVYDGEMCRLTDDAQRLRFHEYARVALMNQHEPQKVLCRISDKLVRIDFKYRLPETELRFLRLIAWPESIDLLNEKWTFNMHPALWAMYKERLNFLGYRMEVKDD